MAILDGLCDGDAPGRIATQCKISTKTVRLFKSRLFNDPLSIFHYNVINHLEIKGGVQKSIAFEQAHEGMESVSVKDRDTQTC